MLREKFPLLPLYSISFGGLFVTSLQKQFSLANLETFPVERTPLEILSVARIKLLEEPLELRCPGVDAPYQARLFCHVVDEGVEGFNVFNVVDGLDVEGSCLPLFRKVKFVLPEETKSHSCME